MIEKFSHTRCLADYDWLFSRSRLKRDQAEWERVEAAVADLFSAAIELGGTLSGEHGVGVLKLPYLEMALGPLAIDVMRGIKHALDPRGILNPGKVVPPQQDDA